MTSLAPRPYNEINQTRFKFSDGATVTISDDGGLVCTCSQYADQIARAYRANTVYSYHIFCSHCQHIGRERQLQYWIPEFLWFNERKDVKFPVLMEITEEVYNVADDIRNNPENHGWTILYTYAGQFQNAGFYILPVPEDDAYIAKVRTLLNSPVHTLTFIITGDLRPEFGVAKSDVEKLIKSKGARYRNDVAGVASASALVIGERAGRRKLLEGEKHKVPMLNYYGLEALLDGDRANVTDIKDQRLVQLLD